MNRRSIKFFVAGMVVAAVLLMFSVQTFGQISKGVMDDFYSYKVVAYGSGLTGFFDPKTGMFYVYDTKIHECIIIRQMIVPGKNMKKIK